MKKILLNILSIILHPIEWLFLLVLVIRCKLGYHDWIYHTGTERTCHECGKHERYVNGEWLPYTEY